MTSSRGSVLGLALLLNLGLLGCPPLEETLPLALNGKSCGGDKACVSGFCTSGKCADPSADTDGDGLGNKTEALLGLILTNPDSDGDGIPDGQEVGANPLKPLDQDADGKIDALEMNDGDLDGDCIADVADGDDAAAETDPAVIAQLACVAPGTCTSVAEVAGVSCGTASGVLVVVCACEPASCEPGCDGKSCGDDGCGGSCGACGAGESCEDGACVTTCQPDCEEMACGDDGCGGSCGTCEAGEVCEAGACAVTCEPDCDGAECGDDGCGGSCGACPAGDLCEAGDCVTPCVPECGDAECGDDGCGGSCGGCDDGNACTVDACEAGSCTAEPVLDGTDCGDGWFCEAGTCVEPCVPACDGKNCGDDGCGGSCGTCGDDDVCTADACGEDGVCTYAVIEDCCGQLVYTCPLELGFACTSKGTCEKGNQVFVPGGPFVMGCDPEASTACPSHAADPHTVDVPAFILDRREVTTQEYKNCWWDTASSGACTAPYNSPLCNYPNSRWTHPMNCTSQAQAQTYCEYKGGRLCTESEWEKAARGTDERLYPWGNATPTCDYAHFQGCSPATTTLPPGQKLLGTSPYGAIDMAGNTGEWVKDCSSPDYEQTPVDGSAHELEDCVQHVFRGGGYGDGANGISAVSRAFAYTDPVGYPLHGGIRCCYDLP